MIQRIFFLLFLISLVFLSFAAGVAVTHYRLPPSSLFRDAFEGAEAWREKLFSLRESYQEPGAPSSPLKVLMHNPQKAFAGYTLTARYNDSSASLINMQGNLIHQWKVPFRSAWPSPKHVLLPRPDKRIYWRNAYLYPNGDMLVIYESPGDTPYGYGMIKIDKDSQLMWGYAANAHHDVDVDSSGRIYALTQEISLEKITGAKDYPTPLIEDFVAVLSPEGKEIKKVSIPRALGQSPFRKMLSNATIGKKRDLTHTNSVYVLPSGINYNLPVFKPGQVLLSCRTINALLVLDLETESVVWAVTGPWRGQHSATFLANGNILLFDNVGSQKGSRLLEYNPSTGTIDWSYDGGEQNRFYTRGRGMQQLLANGNILITSSNENRVFEITRDGEIVWEYASTKESGPIRKGKQFTAITKRYAMEALPFLSEIKKK